MSKCYTVLYREHKLSGIQFIDTTWLADGFEAAALTAYLMIINKKAIAASVVQFDEDSNSTQLSYCCTYTA